MTKTSNDLVRGMIGTFEDVIARPASTDSQRNLAGLAKQLGLELLDERATAEELRGQLRMRDLAPVARPPGNVDSAWKAYDRMRGEARDNMRQVRSLTAERDAVLAKLEWRYEQTDELRALLREAGARMTSLTAERDRLRALLPTKDEAERLREVLLYCFEKTGGRIGVLLSRLLDECDNLHAPANGAAPNEGEKP